MTEAGTQEQMLTVQVLDREIKKARQRFQSNCDILSNLQEQVTDIQMAMVAEDHFIADLEKAKAILEANL